MNVFIRWILPKRWTEPIHWNTQKNGWLCLLTIVGTCVGIRYKISIWHVPGWAYHSSFDKLVKAVVMNTNHDCSAIYGAIIAYSYARLVDSTLPITGGSTYLSQIVCRKVHPRLEVVCLTVLANSSNKVLVNTLRPLCIPSDQWRKPAMQLYDRRSSVAAMHCI